MKKEDKTVKVDQIKLEIIEFKVVGDSILVQHAWAKKARDEMYNKQTGKAKKKKEAKNPYQDFLESMYWLDGLPPHTDKANENNVYDYVKGARFCFPSVGFKKAAVSACRHVDGMPMVTAKGAFHVLGNLVEINTPKPPVLREDMVRLSTGVADIRHRGQFDNWEATLRVQFNKAVISAEQVINLFNTAGFAVGLGENRPEKSGDNWGMFHVEQA